MDNSKLGAKIGPRVAELVSKTLISHQTQSQGVKVNLGRYLADEVLRLVSSSLGSHRAPFIKDLLQHPDVSDEAKSVLAEMSGTPVGMEIVSKLMALLGAVKVATEVGVNDLAPGKYAILAAKPNTLLDPKTAAALAASHLVNDSWAEHEASGSGISSDRFSRLLEGARTLPAVGHIIAELQRGLIDTGHAEQLLFRLGYRAEDIPHILELRHELLSPVVWADAVIKGWVRPEQAVGEAQKTGISDTDFGVLLDITGEPPATMEMLEAFRRGIVDKTRLEYGIRQSRLRNEWIDVIERLRYMPPGAATCIEGAVKGHLTPEQSKEKAEHAGLDPSEWQWMYETTGNPPGAMEMVQLWRRGEITEDRVVQSLKQGHLANAYIPDVLKLKRRLPEMGEVLLLQQAGVWDKEHTVRNLQALGYTADDAATIATAGSRSKIMEEWRLAKTTVSTQYELGVISREAAVTALQQVGYERDEADTVVSIVELQRLASQQTAVLSKLRSLYVGYRIDAATCRDALLHIHIPGSQVDQIMELWGLEREANVKTLTEAQIVAAWKAKIIEDAEAMAELQQLGYQPRDAWILLSTANKAPLGAEQSQQTPAS